MGVVLSGPAPFAPGRDTPGQAAGTLPDADQSAGRERRPKLKDVLEGRLPLTPAAKTLLRDSTKEMRRVGGRHVGPQHVLAALLELDPPDPAAELFAGLGVDRAAVRERISDL